MSQTVGPAVPGTKRELLYFGILLVVCLLAFFAFLGHRPLWDVDEGMHAVTAREMVVTGDWITPRFNGEAFYDKPPLFNWLTAISFKGLGFTEFAARLPVALLGLGCVLVTYLLGRRMAGARVGFLAAAILAANPEMIVLSRAVVHDMALAFFLLLALFFLHGAIGQADGRGPRLLAGYACMGLAVLAKGPIGVLLPGLIMAVFLFLEKRLALARRLISGWGLLLFLAVAGPWYLLVMRQHGDYARYFFIQQNVMNFLSAAKARHAEPFYYYLPVLLGGFFPWAALLPLAVARGFRAWRRDGREDRLFLLIWCGVIFFFFSAAQSKLATYILPMFPAMALLTAFLWEELLEGVADRPPRWLLWFAIALSVGTLLTLLYVMWWPPEQFTVLYGIDLKRVGQLVVLITCCALAGILFVVLRRFQLAFSAYVTMVVGGTLCFIVLIVPMINPYRSTKVLGQELCRSTPADQALVFFRRVQDSALFYCRRPGKVVRNGAQLMEYLDSSREALCLIEWNRYQRLAEPYKQGMRIVDRHANKLIVSGKP